VTSLARITQYAQRQGRVMDRSSIEKTLDRILPKVEKPARYTGGEFNSAVKDWSATPFHAVLAFPDIYELGMSNLGLAILYDILNRQSGVLAERVYTPWPDMEAQLREAGLPLYSLETKHPLSDFDLIGFSLPYEQLYTNVLTMLDLGGVPLLASERDERHPLVIAGGHATYNPDPMADFIDAFVIGEGEEVIVEIVEAIREVKWGVGSGEWRAEALCRLAQISGVYVPRFYDVEYHEDSTVAGVKPNVEGVPARVTKRIVPILPPPLTRFIVPFVDVTHNRAVVEIQRGCTRGCRFCHAGFVTRPVRERSVKEILEAVDAMVRETGFEEVALLSLSSSDYTHIRDLVRAISQKYADKHFSISLPSLRIESFSVDLAEMLKDGRQTGFTFAPEAATEAMRRRINKFIPDQQLLDTAREVFSRGWRTIKLYFMIGQPEETLEDVQAIADLAKAVLKEGRKVHGKAAQVNIGCSTFVPKPHTAFQWVPLDSEESVREKQRLLKNQLRGPGLKLSWTEPEQTLLEAFLSRGDRRLGPVILRAWQLGAKLDGWGEHFNIGAWRQAFAENNLDPEFYARRSRSMDEVFPWDHIDVGVRKNYLARDYAMSQKGETRVDCREYCFACGILPTFTKTRMNTPAEAWECPPVVPLDLRVKS
jgi:radical SAM family uncharacterized protein